MYSLQTVGWLPVPHNFDLMADVYNPRKPYLLYTPFYIPTHDGDEWAMSFSNRSGALPTAAISITVAVITLCLWDLVRVIALFFVGDSSWRRILAQATIWNSQDPWSTFKKLADFSYRCIPPSSGPAHQQRSRWRDSGYSAIFAIVALTIFGGSAIIGTFTPAMLQIGNVAPVQPSDVFYPVLPSNLYELIHHSGILVAGALRAMTGATAARNGAAPQLPVNVDLVSDGDQM